MKKGIIIYLLPALLLAVSLGAQTDEKYLDALKKTVSSSRNDTAVFSALSDLGWAYIVSQPLVSKNYAFQELALAKKINRPVYTAQAFNDLALSYSNMMMLDSSLYYNLRALDIRRQLNRKDLIASSLSKIGNIYVQQFKNDLALKHQLEALAIYEALKDDLKAGMLYADIGETYDNLHINDKSISYNEKAVKISEKLGDEYSYAKASVNLGYKYGQHKEYGKAYENIDRAIVIFEKINDSLSLSAAYSNKGVIKKQEGRLAEAEQLYKKSIEIATVLRDTLDISNTFHNLGALYIAEKKYSEAEKIYRQLLLWAPDTKMRLLSYKQLATVYAYMDRGAEAEKNIGLYDELKDSLFTTENAMAIADLQTVYETNKKEQTIRLLEKDNALKIEEAFNQEMLFAFIIVVILLLALGLFYNQRQKQKNILAAQRQEEEKKRINAMITSEEKERTRIARELHDGLGQLLSTARLNAASLEGSVEKEDEHLLQNTLNLIDQSVSEVRSVSHNLMPQMLMEKGLPDALKELVNTINSSKTLDITFDHAGFNMPLPASVEFAIYRVIQEVLNNMIKHATASKIDLKLALGKNELKIFISDNGKGFDTALIEKSEGIGWRNILTRLSLINGKFDVNSNPGQGTTVNIAVAL